MNHVRSSRLRWMVLAIALLAAIVGGTAWTEANDAEAALDPSLKEWTERLESGLQWLVKHQSSDGRWSAEGPQVATEKEKESLTREIRGRAKYDVAATALAMRAFTAYSHTHKTGEHVEYVEAVAKAAKWLLDQQDSSESDRGAIGWSRDGKKKPGESAFSNHALATHTLAELLLLSGDRKILGPPCTRASRYLLELQTEGGGFSLAGDGPADVLGTYLAINALNVLEICARLKLGGGSENLDSGEIRTALDRAVGWLVTVWNEETGVPGFRKKADSLPSHRYFGPNPRFSTDQPFLTCLAVNGAIIARESRSAPHVKAGFDRIESWTPTWQLASEDQKETTVNFGLWYAAMYSVHQHGGELWKQKSEPIRTLLIGNQEMTGDAAGSWPPVGPSGPFLGRVGATALALMTVEKNYVYLR